MPATEVVALLAVTVDGYVARADGSVDYLDDHPVEEFDFAEFLAGVDGVVMGRSSYEQAVDFGWTLGDRRTTVLTTRQGLPVPGGADVRFSAAPTGEAIRSLAAECDRRLWVFGGGRVVTDAVRAGVVDTLDLTVVPEVLGSGIPLFTSAVPGPLRLVDTTPYVGGAYRVVYDLTGRV